MNSARNVEYSVTTEVKDGIDAEKLARELHQQLSGEVRFDAQAKALYATDASNYRQIPIGVVIPRTKDDIVKTIDLCRQAGAPLLSRGAGTSLAGQCCNVAVVMDLSRYYNQILNIDSTGCTARVQPGVVLDRLRHTAEKQHLTFGPDPATHSRCTLGGMIGNNSCGVHALMAGKTVDNVESLEILTYDGLRLEVGRTPEAELEKIIRSGGRGGEIYSKLKAIRDKYADLIRSRFPKIPRRVSGYNLDELLPENGFNVARALVGTEGTCVTVLEAMLRLIPNPAARSLLVLGYPTVYSAADDVMRLLEHKPIGLEGMDEGMVGNLKRYHGFPGRIQHLPTGQAWLLVEFAGDSKVQAEERARGLMSALEKGAQAPSMKLFQDAHETEDIWTIRESALAATAFIPGQRDRLEGWEDSAVPPEKLGAYLRDLRALYDRYGYQGAFYGHFGDGCLHTRIDFDQDTQEGRKQWRTFMDDAADLVVRYGGSLSGEHGDGQARAELFPKMFGPELVEAFREFKTVWDPQNKMNPGKVVNAYGILDNLRLGENYRPAKPQTYFQFPDDKDNFARAALRCVGVGKCRREEGGTMCPSYMVTRDEKDSTRGRAHLLFEMLKGETIRSGWKSEEVKDSLDLCLSCKGCKSDCPTNVDMATYKAEFLSHYYEGRMRPVQAYAFGLIYWWARLASLMPRVVNFFTQTPGFSHLTKALAGMPRQRKIPVFATETFRQWYFKRRPSPPPSPHGVGRGDFLKSPPLDSPRPTEWGEGGGEGSHRVILWADTFNNHFHPDTAKAAVQVLEAAGFQVNVPRQSLCCGRPLYDYGMLKLAKRMLSDILDALRPQIRAGIPVIGLEPSCVTVFRDELLNLFPQDEDAKRLSEQTFLLSEFLIKKVPNYQPPQLNRKALVQGHCHHKSVLGFDAERQLMEKMGLEVSSPEAGCCGMAGSFGFEKDHYDVSMKVGEQALLPAARQASRDTLLISSGFSCREQITQATDRPVLHIAEVLAMKPQE